MLNLLQKLKSYRTCKACGQQKPLSAFRLLINLKGKETRDTICASCRIADSGDDEGGSGGKQLSLTNEAVNTAAQTKKNQETEEQKAGRETKEYAGKLDNTHKDDLQKKAAQQELVNEKRRLLDKTKGLFKSLDAIFGARKGPKPDRTHTEMGFDADTHDPFRQIPVNEHHKIYLTHPDRMDVKFLLEYRLSGEYAQAHSHLIGRRDRHTTADHPTTQTLSQGLLKAGVHTPQSPQKMAQLTHSSQQFQAQNITLRGPAQLAQTAVTISIANQAFNPQAPTLTHAATHGMFNQSNTAAPAVSGKMAFEIAAHQNELGNTYDFDKSTSYDKFFSPNEEQRAEQKSDQIIRYTNQTWK